MPAFPASLALLALCSLQAGAAVAMTSPWWENYEEKELYLCGDRAVLTLERNDAQAALFADGRRSTLFREPGPGPALRYRSDNLVVVLRGDELTLVGPLSDLTCTRTEQV
jgi:hypothetical protein